MVVPHACIQISNLSIVVHAILYDIVDVVPYVVQYVVRPNNRQCGYKYILQYK